MTKSELIRAVSEKLPHLPGKDLEIVVNTIFDTMTHALGLGDRIEIRGFGSFTVRQRRARVGRNPKTGETIEVPAKRVPFFTVGHELKRRVDEGRDGDGAEPFNGEAEHDSEYNGDATTLATSNMTLEPNREPLPDDETTPLVEP
ncbi:MAG: integration host factor subunit beta [Myxococcota bacterium]